MVAIAVIPIAIADIRQGPSTSLALGQISKSVAAKLRRMRASTAASAKCLRRSPRSGLERSPDWLRITCETPGAQPVLSGHSGVEGSVAEAMTHRGYSLTGVRDRNQVIVGAAGSPGRAHGTARIIPGPDSCHRFQPGDVLDANVTTPLWTPLCELAPI